MRYQIANVLEHAANDIEDHEKNNENAINQLISWKSYYDVMVTKKTPHKPLKTTKLL